MPARRPTARRPTARWAALCWAAAMVLTACTQATAGSASPGSLDASGPTLERFYGQALAWDPCVGYATSAADRQLFDNPQFACSRLQVPLDYAAPDGRTAQIGVLRQRASGAKIGSLLFNPGGPGGSGMSFVAALAGRLTQGPLPQRFDLVGFDPRGVGASTPTIDCIDDAEWEAERADLDVDPTPAGVEQTEAENRQYAAQCTERSGGAEVLANVGTRDVVRDLDILRAALGDEKLTYVGYSYGTRIGSGYAEVFPQNVRALVLDGALNPAQASADRTVQQNAGFQKAFEAYAADCARLPTCPLGTDPTQATAAFVALTRPLVDAPAAAEGGTRRLSHGDAITGVVQALYVSDAWPFLSRAISQLAGGDGTFLLRLADAYYNRAASGVYGNGLEAFVVISCADEERITDRTARGELIRRAVEAAPFRDPGRGVVAALDTCAFWPTPPTGQPHVPQVTALPQPLVVSTTGDPATPYQAGVDLAQALQARLLTFEGTQHTAALRGTACVDVVVVAYLVDLRLPGADVRCAS